MKTLWVCSDFSSIPICLKEKGKKKWKQRYLGKTVFQIVCCGPSIESLFLSRNDSHIIRRHAKIAGVLNFPFHCRHDGICRCCIFRSEKQSLIIHNDLMRTPFPPPMNHPSLIKEQPFWCCWIVLNCKSLNPAVPPRWISVEFSISAGTFLAAKERHSCSFSPTWSWSG